VWQGAGLSPIPARCFCFSPYLLLDGHRYRVRYVTILAKSDGGIAELYVSDGSSPLRVRA
jgi:hypothetical protein